MAIAPLNTETVRADQGQVGGVDIRRYPSRIEQRTAGHFFHARGAGTRQPELAGREETLVARLVPFDLEAGVAPVDGVGNQEIYVS